MADKILDQLMKSTMTLAQLQMHGMKWFNQEASALRNAGVNAEHIINHSKDHASSRILPGYMYLFKYDPKGKLTLPYYDMYPLLLPWSTFTTTTSSGFIGLNLHYLDYKMRIQILDALQEFATSKTLDENTKLQYSWRLIRKAAKYTPARVCVKQYLADHVRSPFRKIDAQNWATASMLPVHKFVGADVSTIWSKAKW